MFSRLILVPFISGLLVGVLVASAMLLGLGPANAGQTGTIAPKKDVVRPDAPKAKKPPRRPWLEGRGQRQTERSQRSQRTQREAGLYMGARGGYMFYDRLRGSAAVSGYGPPPQSHTDFTSALDGGFEASVTNSGGAQLQLGLAWPVPLLALNGYLRVEGDAGWSAYETEICFAGIPADFPDLTEPLLDGQPALAVVAVQTLRVPLCQRHEEAVWNFGGNLFYDLSIAAIVEGMRREPGIWSGLYLTAGAGAGYVLNSNNAARQILALDADEPLHDGGNRLQFIAAADTNTDNTVAEAPDAVASGIYVPIYAGFTFLAPWFSDVLALEFLYRYNALAPKGFQSHSVIGGVRYRF